MTKIKERAGTPVLETYGDHDVRPRPDPTVLTTAALTREVASLKEIVFTRLEGMDRAIVLFNENITRVPTDTDKQISHLKELHETRFSAVGSDINLVQTVIETRFAGMDRAIVLLQDIADTFLERIDEKLLSLKDNHEEKFCSIQVQFKERDVRTEQSSNDSKVAVDAALQAAKEAVGEQNKSSALAIAKSETSTAKTIDQIMQLISTSNGAMNDKFDDVKERLTRIEGKGEGKVVAEVSTNSSKTFMIGLVSVVIAFISVGVMVVIAMKH